MNCAKGHIGKLIDLLWRLAPVPARKGDKIVETQHKGQTALKSKKKLTKAAGTETADNSGVKCVDNCSDGRCAVDSKAVVVCVSGSASNCVSVSVSVS